MITTTTQTLGPLQRAWVDKLRHGGFSQTTDYLHDRKGYCCLGVALEHAKATDPLAVKRDDGAALDYLARKRADEAEAGLSRVHWWLTAALLFTVLAGVTLAVAAYADPVARLAHDTARGEYCGAC